uniref:hypothetical protein n=1 Tax=Streptococcus pneumoniae TaxID=1313 RepID=UPI00195470FB
TVEPVPDCCFERSPTTSVLIEVKIIDIQAPYHIRLQMIQVRELCLSNQAIEITEPAIKSADEINVVL